MTKLDEFREHARNVERLVSRLEKSDDPAMRSAGQELVQSLMALHGSALEKILEVIALAGEAGIQITERIGNDERVRSLLLLYGLHPQNLQVRVTRAVENFCKQFESRGVAAELISVTDSGDVAVQFKVKSNGCGSTAASLKAQLEGALLDSAPDAQSIRIHDLSESTAGSTFVHLAKLQGVPSQGTNMASSPLRSGD